VPVGVLVLLATTAWLPRGARRRSSIDVGGALTVTSALALAAYAIVTANQPAVTAARTALLLVVSGLLAPPSSSSSARAANRWSRPPSCGRPTWRSATW
jgi:hypothetical protein